jgi:hypothetical protein
MSQEENTWHAGHRRQMYPSLANHSRQTHSPLSPLEQRSGSGDSWDGHLDCRGFDAERSVVETSDHQARAAGQKGLPNLKKKQDRARRLWRRCLALFSVSAAFKHRHGKSRGATEETNKDQKASSSDKEPDAAVFKRASSIERVPGNNRPSDQEGISSGTPRILARASTTEGFLGDEIHPLAPNATQGSSPMNSHAGTLFPSTQVANIGGGSWYAASNITIIQNIYVERSPDVHQPPSHELK